MSMNLTCYQGEQKIPLWQTPTHITWMCLSLNPLTKESDGGNEGVRHRYLLWVASHADGVWHDTPHATAAEELQDMRDLIAEHCAKILALTEPIFSWS